MFAGAGALALGIFGYCRVKSYHDKSKNQLFSVKHVSRGRIAPQIELNHSGFGNPPLPGSSRPGGLGGGPFATGRGICCALGSVSVL